jgi:small neutral amino acid transporter SnatA (MarC family)
MTMIGPSEIFTIFFVTLGPLKTLGPFVKRTHGLDDRVVRQIAVRAFLIAVPAIVIGSLIGQRVLDKWHVSIGALAIAAGIILFLVALQQLLERYEPPEVTAPAPLPASPAAAAMRLLFPIVLTPYGIAASIVLLAARMDTPRTEVILALLVAVMVLDLLAMLFARRILVGWVIVVLQVLGGVLEVLQVALGIQFVLKGLQFLGVTGLNG